MADRAAYVNQFNCQKIDGVNVELQAGRTGRPFSFDCTTSVKVGDYFNAAKAQLTFSGAGGEVAGMASAFNAEINLPNKIATSGAYTALEINYNFQASTVLQDTSDTPQCLATFKVGGTSGQIDAWEAQTYSGIFAFSGLSAADDEVFDTQAVDSTCTAGLRIFVNGTAYWIMLCTDRGS